MGSTKWWWALSLLLVAAACARDDSKVPSVPVKAIAGSITSSACTYKDGETEYKAQCGVLVVPENRDKAASPLIALSYQRILSTARNPAEPVFFLNGGPGQSNMTSGGTAGWFLARRDVVLLGYRGVDGGARLECPEVDKAVRRRAPFLDHEGQARLGKAFRQCAERVTTGGADLAGYTVTEVVDDMEALRRALGYQQIDLLSVSYGTRLAMIYAWRYPDRVRRSAMIAVNPPGHFRFDPARLEAQLKLYAGFCSADDYCRSRTDDLTADMRRALANMPERWLLFPINRDAVLLATVTALYSTDSAASVFDMWIAAARGDYRGMAVVTAAYPYLIPKMAWGDAAAKGSADFSRDSRLDDDEVLPGRYLLGAPLNVLGAGATGNWPLQPIAEEYRKVRPSSVRTLLVGGSLDVSTPVENARDELMPLFSNADQVVLKEFAHAQDVLYAQPDAARRLLTSFFDTGTTDSSRFAYRPVRFDPGWLSFQLFANAGIAVAFFLVVAILLVARSLYRRIKRRAAP